MARPTQFSDEEILHAARACFIEHGPGVSTTVIAKRVGMSQAALFKRFGSKMQLMVRAMQPEGEPLWETVRAMPIDDRPMADQLLDLATTVARWFERLIPQMMVLKASGMDLLEEMGKGPGDPPPVKGLLAMADYMRRAHEAGLLHAPDPTALAMQFMGAIHVRMFWRHMAGGRFVQDTDEAYFQSLAAHTVRGASPTHLPHESAR